MNIVGICNLALAHLGDPARVTSINPSDGSVQATLCARYYPEADAILRTSEDWLLVTDENDGTTLAVQSVSAISTNGNTASIYALVIPGVADSDKISTYDYAKSWLLASMLAGPILKGDAGAAQSKSCLQSYALWKGQALLQDARLRVQEAPPLPSAVLARA